MTGHHRVGVGRGNINEWDEEVQTTMYKMNKMQGYNVQHREYNQYVIITLYGMQFIKISNHYVVHLKLI